MRRLPALVVVFLLQGCADSPDGSSLQFEITLSSESADEIRALGLEVPVVGRVFVIVSRTNDREPRLSTGVTGVPLWGVDVRGLAAGQTVALTDGRDTVRNTKHPTRRRHKKLEVLE